MKQITINKMKQITMSLETARKIWADSKPAHYGTYGTDLFNPTRMWLLENFNLYELEGKEGFTWEESFSNNGYFINKDSLICFVGMTGTDREKQNIFKTKKQALSAIAYAQLTHIVSKYNEGKERCSKFYAIISTLTGLDICECHLTIPLLLLYDYQDAKISIRVNRELWEQYYML